MSRRRWFGRGLVVGAVALGFAGCEGWHDWDNVFNRDKRNATLPVGWRSADGDAVIRIPEVGAKTTLVDRTLRGFGDTWVYSDNEQFNDFRASPEFTSLFTPRNTIAVHDAGSNQYDPPSASEIKFYATDGSTGTRKDMTTIGENGSGQSHAKAFILSTDSTCANDPANCWFWPAGGGETIIEGNESSTFVFYTRWMKPDLCAYDQAKTFVYEISNPEESNITNWTITGYELVRGASDNISPIDDELEWGVATIKHPSESYVYVYGNTLLRLQTCPWVESSCGLTPSGDFIERENVVLARVPYALGTCSSKPCFANYKTKWEFWWNNQRNPVCSSPVSGCSTVGQDCWCNSEPTNATDLRVVADGAAPWYSVSYVNMQNSGGTNVARYLLTQSDPNAGLGDTDGAEDWRYYIRFSSSITSFPSIGGGIPNTWSSDITAFDWIGKAAATWLASASNDRCDHLLANDQDARAYQAQALPKLSRIDGTWSGTNELVVGYHMTGIWPDDVYQRGCVYTDQPSCDADINCRWSSGTGTCLGECSSYTTSSPCDGNSNCRWDSTLNKCLFDWCTNNFQATARCDNPLFSPLGYEECKLSGGVCRSQPISGKMRYTKLNLESFKPWCSTSCSN